MWQGRKKVAAAVLALAAPPVAYLTYALAPRRGGGPRPPPAKAGSSYVTVRSSRCSELPEGRRVSPSQAHLMARLQTPDYQPVVTAPPGSHHWRLRCLEFTQ